ncbi:MAG TPA: PilX N-terminal domain-containing pilus assembly protein [Woeseiaceae bacterium]|nr:PilX N-terminal domain-containing pilus assembly protein [Woeseiaceae bacterium]
MQCQKLPRGRQDGAALILALIFLLLMTMLSTSSMRTSAMQERMAGNTRDWNLGFQSAEAALRVAEEWLRDTVVLPEFNDAAGLYQVNSTNRPVWLGAATTEGGGALAYPVDLAGTADRPRYYIEKLSSIRPPGASTETGTPVEEINYFRVTAIGFGGAEDTDGDPLTTVVLSSVYRSR